MTRSKRQLTDYARHPDFENAWKLHSRLVWWAARRMANRYGGEPEDYVGQLTLRLNRCLYGYDQNNGRMTTYFLSHIDQEIKTHVLCNRRKVVISLQNGEIAKLQQRDPRYSGKSLSIADRILDHFINEDDFWSFVCNGMDDYCRFVFLLHFRHGYSYSQIGSILDKTKSAMSLIGIRATKIAECNLIHFVEELREEKK